MTALVLRPGPVWNSFEELRNRFAQNLASIEPGMVAQIVVKRRKLRVMRDADFQALMNTVGLVQEAAILSADVQLALEAYHDAPTEAGLELMQRLTDRLMVLRGRL